MINLELNPIVINKRILKQVLSSIGLKRCSRCMEVKPLESFSTDPSHHPEGRRSNCKACSALLHVLAKKERILSLNKDGLKECAHCKEIKGLSHFGNNIRQHDGLHYWCRDCCKNAKKENKEAYAKQQKEWAAINKDTINSKRRVYRSKNPEKVMTMLSKRRAAKLQAVPSWGNNWLEKLLIEEMYLVSKTRSIVTGIQHEVDHIIPLQNEIVQGFHCSANLRVVTQSENASKCNKLIEELL